MSKTLKQVKCGETVTVQKLQGEGPSRKLAAWPISRPFAARMRPVDFWRIWVLPLGSPLQ